MLMNIHIIKLITILAVSMRTSIVLAADNDKAGGNHSRIHKAKVGGNHSRIQGLENDLATEMTLLTAADSDLQQQLDNIRLTPGPKGDAGTHGINGIDGANGIDGVDGTNGIDGTSCTAIQGEGSATISCEDGTMASVYDYVGGTVSRSTSFVTGLIEDGKDRGFVSGRTLLFNKLRDSSDLRISYTDNFRAMIATSGVPAACTWEIYINGTRCASTSARLQYSKFDHFNGGVVGRHSSSTVVGYCQGLPSGVNAIQVYVSPHVSSPVSDCFTGRQSTFLLEAEEVN